MRPDLEVAALMGRASDLMSAGATPYSDFAWLDVDARTYDEMRAREGLVIYERERTTVLGIELRLVAEIPMSPPDAIPRCLRLVMRPEGGGREWAVCSPYTSAMYQPPELVALYRALCRVPGWEREVAAWLGSIP